MANQLRSVAEEETYNQRWLLGTLLGTILIPVVAAAWMVLMADRLPAELATHWNGKNEVDGYSSLWGMVGMTIAVGAGTGSVISVLAIATRSQNLLLARIGLAFGVALGVGVTAMMVAVVAGQLDLTDASRAQLSGPVMAGGLAAAFVFGTAVLWLYRPGEIQRSQNPDIAAVNATATVENGELARVAQTRAALGETLRIKVSMGRWAWVLSLGLGTVMSVSMYFIIPALALLGIVAAALVWVFCQGTAVIGPDGVKVLASGFWKLMPLSWPEINKATVEDVKAMDYGGWGYRMNGGSVGFIMASGPALVMDVGFHQKFVISMPSVTSAGEAMALVNAYVHNVKVKK
ncbi:hypothetical protein MB46_09095 [Arthrobacter alpinus]|uniref:DUF1648 domain-containing protein n=1 Tax=Arthrobacter alpinus TaxID=656366 RepID=UPI0005C86532|nr:DUF1648 domain-containing protein [Arthrobacter alpinus]ALV45621.1 hypothetical protein MB46_09095 [Arthrobacter alpinus]